MAWSAPRGVDDLVQKLANNRTATTMCILSTRKVGPTDAVALATALTINKSLRELLASGHRLGVSEASAFGRALASNTALRSLCLGDHDFGDEGVQALVEDGLKSNVGLLVLDLEYKSITSGEALCSLLQRHITLTDLRLGRNQLGASAVTAISKGLSQNSTLTRLDLSGNVITAVAVEALGRALSASHAPSTTTATVTDVDDEVPTELNNSVNVRFSAPPLEDLNLSRNPLGDEGGAALFRALSGCASLRSLSLAEAGLGRFSAAALAEALAPTKRASATAIAAQAALSSDLNQQRRDAGHESAANGSINVSIGRTVASCDRVEDGGESGRGPPRGLVLLEKLDLSRNEFGRDGAETLARALDRGGAPQLESLSMGYNGVGDGGATAIGRAVGKGLRVLDLSGNSLTGLGIQAILSAPGLRKANLFHNACGDAEIPRVLEAVLGATHLQTLDLGANGLTGAGFEAFLPGLAECSSLQTLEVGANSNDDRAEAAVRQSQANNPGLDIAFRRGGEAMEGSGAPPGVAAEMEEAGSQLRPSG